MSTMNTVGRPTAPNQVQTKPATLTGGRGRSRVGLHLGHIFGSGDGDDVGVVHQPSQGYLRSGGAMLRPYLGQRVQ